LTPIFPAKGVVINCTVVHAGGIPSRDKIEQQLIAS